jgi:hypothetical protein
MKNIDNICIADKINYKFHSEVFKGGECIPNNYNRISLEFENLHSSSVKVRRFHSNRGGSSSTSCRRTPVESYNPNRYLYVVDSISGYSIVKQNKKMTNFTYDPDYFRNYWYAYSNLDCIIENPYYNSNCTQYLEFKCYIYKEEVYSNKMFISDSTYDFCLIVSIILLILIFACIIFCCCLISMKN